MAEQLTLGLCIEPFSRGMALTPYVLSLFDHAFDLYSSRLLQMTIGLLSALLWDFRRLIFPTNRRGVHLP